MKQLLYRAPGPIKRHGVMVEIGEFEQDDVKAAIADGWCYTPTETKPKKRKAKSDAVD